MVFNRKLFKESTYKILTILFLIGYNFTPPILAADQIFNFGGISEKLNVNQEIDTSEDILKEGISDPEWIAKGDNYSSQNIDPKASTKSSAAFAAGEVCPLNPDNYNCTANDVSLASASFTSVNSDTCDFPGDTIKINLFADVVTTASNRYDIGVWIYPFNNSTTCEALKLPIPPAIDVDGDICGDTSSAGTIQNVPLGQVTLSCVDMDIVPDGYLDVPVITTWDNNSTGICNVGLDTLPGAPSKCKKEPKFSIPVPIPGQIIVNKVTEPAGSTESFAFNINGNTHNIDFSLINGQSWNSGVIAGGLLAGIYTVTEKNLPNDWDLKSAVCTSSKNGSEPAGAINLQPGEIVNCTFTNQKKSANLTVVKNVVNDNGGLATPNQFGISVNGSTVTSGVKGSYAVGEALTINETELTGYNFVDITGDAKCPTTLGGTVTLAPGDDITCTIKNDDIEPKLTLNKVVVNDNGGTLSESAWTLFAKQGETIALTGLGATGDTDVVSTPTFKAGTYTLSESGPTGYSASNWSCIGGTQNGNSITLGLNESALCTITNDDIAPKLIVNKVVVDGLFGTKGISEFPLFVGTTSVTSGIENTFNVGNYVVSETNQEGYTSVISGQCDTSGNVTLALGDDKVCTITNTSIWGQITLKKVVNPTNDITKFAFTGSLSGSIGHNETISKVVLPGTYTVTETLPTGWSLTDMVCSDTDSTVNKITGTATYVVGNNEGVTCTYTNTKLGSISGYKWNDADGSADTTTDRTVVPGWTVILKDANGIEITRTTTNISGYYEFNGLLPANYIVTEGITTGWIVLIGDSKNIALDAGENETNVDFVNVEYGSIKVLKNVDGNGDGDLVDAVDTVGSSDWSWTINNVNAGTTGTTKTDLIPGVYTVKETGGLSNYHFVSLSCTGSSGITTNGNIATVNLQSGEDVVCTYTNARDLGNLIVKKVVINDNGGSLKAKDFSFQIDTGAGIAFEEDGQNEFTKYAGLTYDIVEVNPNTRGYTTTYSNCDDIMVPYNQTATCTITNDDVAPTLKLNKIVNGGSKNPVDWTLTAQGDTGFSDLGNSTVSHTVKAGITYVLSESGPTGYSQSWWTCDKGEASGNTVKLSLGENATCTITNTYIPYCGDGFINQDSEQCDDGNTNNNDGCSNICQPESSITVIKVDNLNSGQDFSFNFTPLGSATTQFVLDDDNTTDSTHSDTNTFSNLVSGFYDINEVATFGWTPSIVECTSNYNLINYPQYSHWYGTLSIGLRPGENLVCTFENIRDTGTLQVLKNVDLNGDGDYTDSGETGATNWLWQIDGGSNHNTGDSAITIPTGTYHLTETNQTNYHVTGLSCTGGVVDGSDVIITKDANVICTFTNARDTGRVTFIKTVDQGPGQPSNWTFSVYDGNGGLLGDTFTSGNTYTIETGSYRLEESSVEGYSFDSASGICSVDQTNGKITLTVSTNGGTCTISNLRDVGSVKVNKKIDDDGNGTFEKGNTYANSNGFGWELDGVGRTFGSPINNLATTLSNYYHNFTEYMPIGYHFVSWYSTNESGKSCANPNGEALPDRIQVNKNQLTEITLCNARDTGTVTIIKDAINNSWEEFFFDTNLPSGDFRLADDGYNSIGLPKQKSFTVPTGNYYVDERNESGWKLTNLVCIGDDNSAVNVSNGRVDIILDYGENVVCTYTNTELAKIWGFKYNDENGNGAWNLGEWGLGNWTIFIDETEGNGKYDGTERSTLTSNYMLSLGFYEFDNLLPGTYSICEQLQDSWSNTNPVCRTVSLTPGDVDGSVNFSNIRYGSILVHKFEDTNGDGDIDANENGLENWQMNVYRGYGCTGSVISEYTDDNGDAQFNNIVAGHYSVMETNQEGWVTTTPVCQNIHVNPGQTTSVNIGNVILTDIHGYKWSDVNGNGLRDCLTGEVVSDRIMCELEPLLSGWTINLFKSNEEGYETEPFRTMITQDEDEFGWYWFENLLPGKYMICEVQQEGWTQTYPINEMGNCHEISLPIESGTRSLNYVDGYEYDFGNTKDPLLEIQKSNNKQTIDQIPGDEVIYTITITAPQRQIAGKYIVKNVVVSDIAPSGFNYVPNSWTVVSSIRGNIQSLLTEPIYNGIKTALWSLGDMEEGEIITLTYKTKISLLTDSGIYPDIAWVKGKSVLNTTVLGNISTGATTPFVGTEVSVIEPLKTEEGEVLGATTYLPNTGSSTYLTFASLITMILGLATVLFSPKKKYLKKLALSFVLFFLILPSSVFAEQYESLIVKIEQPKSPTRNQSFNIDFTSQSINEDEITIDCYQNDVLFFTLTGHSGSCPVTIQQSGTYKFYVIARTVSLQIQSVPVIVVVDLQAPLPVVDYTRTNNVLNFKTANDGRTTMVEIFRSDKSQFLANSSTLLTTMPAVPNTAYSYTDTTVEVGKTYYYALRAVDALGNVSSLVADKVVVTLPVSTSDTPSVVLVSVPQEEEITVEIDKDGEVEGAQEEVESEKDEDLNKDTIQEKVITSFKNYWYIWGIGILVAGGLVYISVRRNNKNKQR